MVVKNEADRYLKEVLLSAKKYITDAVIIDDGSTDNTTALCEEVLDDIPHRIIKNTESKFHNEWELREQQWYETTKDEPEWIIFLDADEIFEDGFAEGIKDLMADDECDLYSFRLYDFWDDNHYREDPLWLAHLTFRPFLLRYNKDFPYFFKHTSQHCGRMPDNVYLQSNKNSHYRVKHYGWATKEDRVAKYNRYMELDPNGTNGSLDQYESILDENPNLLEWQEE
jgi:glycosyltransferase involved in cell wall biosynthesis